MDKELIDMLHESNYSCVIRKGKVTRTFVRRGIKDMYELIAHEKSFLSGARVADKVVGKAAAGLMIIGGVKEVYADVISSPALALFQQYGLPVSYGKEVDHIVDRTGTDWCPMERATFSARDAAETYRFITDFLNQNK